MLRQRKRAKFNHVTSNTRTFSVGAVVTTLPGAVVRLGVHGFRFTLDPASSAVLAAWHAAAAAAAGALVPRRVTAAHRVLQATSRVREPVAHLQKIDEVP